MRKNISLVERNGRDRKMKICYSSLCNKFTPPKSVGLFICPKFIQTSWKYSTLIDDQDSVKITFCKTRKFEEDNNRSNIIQLIPRELNRVDV